MWIIWILVGMLISSMLHGFFPTITHNVMHIVFDGVRSGFRRVISWAISNKEKADE